MENLFNKTILVTGALGQLGKEFQQLAPFFTSGTFLFSDRDDLPIDDYEGLDKYFEINNIDFCINCAAYTAVDNAETDTVNAFLINAKSVENLALVCKKYSTRFIHISTDYVFDGESKTPYKEDDLPNPQSVYGLSKLKGEELALEHNPSTIIIRTSWVYSVFGNNFVKTMMRVMKARDSINVVNDQFGCPTYARDLADATLHIISLIIKEKILVLPQPAIFHYCNEGVISWYDFAMEIKELTGSACVVHPICSAEYPVAAKRPAWSALDTSRIQSTFELTIPDWKSSLKNCLLLFT